MAAVDKGWSRIQTIGSFNCGVPALRTQLCLLSLPGGMYSIEKAENWKDTDLGIRAEYFLLSTDLKVGRGGARSETKTSKQTAKTQKEDGENNCCRPQTRMAV